MRLILDFRALGGHFWLAYFTPMTRRHDLPDRPGAVSTQVEFLTAEEVGQELGGN